MTAPKQQKQEMCTCRNWNIFFYLIVFNFVGRINDDHDYLSSVRNDESGCGWIRKQDNGFTILHNGFTIVPCAAADTSIINATN